jgi:hypothetical protein
MYFATLTEVPILQGLMASGMGKGPALALLLAGPSLSLPNMLVIRGIIGNQKTVVYVSLVIVMATISGLIFARCKTKYQTYENQESSSADRNGTIFPGVNHCFPSGKLASGEE